MEHVGVDEIGQLTVKELGRVLDITKSTVKEHLPHQGGRIQRFSDLEGCFRILGPYDPFFSFVIHIFRVPAT